jgi:hypothetical protein
MSKANNAKPFEGPPIHCKFIGCTRKATVETPAGPQFCDVHADVYAKIMGQRGAISVVKPTTLVKTKRRGTKKAKRKSNH